MRSNSHLRAAVVVLLLLPIGCGYRWVGSPSDRAPGPNLRIDLFANDTHEARLGEIFSEAFRKEVIRRSYFRLATGEEAESRIIGKVKSIRWTPVIYDADGGVARYEVTLEASAEWLDSFDSVLGKAVGRRTVEFASNPNPTMNESARRIAATEAAVILAETLLDDLMQGF